LQNGSYPPPVGPEIGCGRRVSGDDGGDDVEGGCALKLRGIDGGSDLGLGFGGPHGAIAIGDLSLDHGWSEFALGERWPGLSGQGFAVLKWNLCRWCFADVGLARREGVARPE
jgi:hypothetical protein